MQRKTAFGRWREVGEISGDGGIEGCMQYGSRYVFIIANPFKERGLLTRRGHKEWGSRSDGYGNLRPFKTSPPDHH